MSSEIQMQLGPHTLRFRIAWASIPALLRG